MAVRRHRAGWVERTLGLLDTRGVSDRVRERSADILALSYLRAELAVLATPGDEPLAQASYLNELRGLLSLVAVPTELASRGVELLTPASLFGAQVPHLIVLGALDGVLPPALKDDPALDFLERRRLRAAGMPVETAATLARRGQLDFWALLRAVGSAELSYARHMGRQEGLPSPFLDWLPLLPGAGAWRRAVRKKPGAARSPAGASPSTGRCLPPAARTAWKSERLGQAHDGHDGMTGEAMDPEALTSAPRSSACWDAAASAGGWDGLGLGDQRRAPHRHAADSHAALEFAARRAPGRMT